MNASPHGIASHFLCRDAPPNLVFCEQFGVQPLQKWYDVNHKRLKVAGRSSSHLSNTCEKAHEILQQQWVSPLAI